MANTQARTCLMQERVNKFSNTWKLNLRISIFDKINCKCITHNIDSLTPVVFRSTFWKKLVKILYQMYNTHLPLLIKVWLKKKAYYTGDFTVIHIILWNFIINYITFNINHLFTIYSKFEEKMKNKQKIWKFI